MVQNRLRLVPAVKRLNFGIGFAFLEYDFEGMFVGFGVGVDPFCIRFPVRSGSKWYMW